MKISPVHQKKLLLYPLATVAAAGCVVLSGCQQQQRVVGKPSAQMPGGVVTIEPSKEAPEVKPGQKPQLLPGRKAVHQGREKNQPLPGKRRASR